MIKYKLPTGYLFTDDYSKGKLETLSIGDYGKSKNIKADFLGFTKELNGVDNQYCMPLSEKWVVTLSTQYGCLMKCNFCDVPNVEWKGNVTVQDLKDQLYSALGLFQDVSYTERLNIHFARMGEPIFNDAVFDFTEGLIKYKKSYQDILGLRVEVIHPVMTTSLPERFGRLKDNIKRWIDIKNNLYNGQAGLQFSINSTNEEQRNKMFNNMSLSLKEFSKMAEYFDEPLSRKYCLNFAYASDYEIDGEYLAKLFDPEKFMCKITPIHNNNSCKENGIETIGGYNSYSPYAEAEESLKKAGFDTLVFIPSMDEENGLVTCGNAILGGSKLKL